MTRLGKVTDRVDKGMWIAEAEDFTVDDWTEADPDLVTQDPSWTLYSVDLETSEAVFVQTPADVQVHDAPFMYLPQREKAVQVMHMPFETFHQVAENAPIRQEDIVHINSVGRCGSTLVSKALGILPGVASLSEPDVLTKLTGDWGFRNFEGKEHERLVRSCTIAQCLAPAAMGKNKFALKYRSYVTYMGSLMAAAMPQAKQVFMYRKLETWFVSYVKLVGGGDFRIEFRGENYKKYMQRIVPQLEAMEEMTIGESVVCHWLYGLECAVKMQRAGTPLFVFRYEELKKDPLGTLSALCTFCDLPRPKAEELEKVMAEDSQEGTRLSQSAMQDVKVKLTDDDVDYLHQIVRANSTIVEPDEPILGTWGV